MEIEPGPQIVETEQITVQLSEQIEETEPLKLEPITELDAQTPEIEVTVDDCEMLYGVVLETAHSIIGTRKEGVSHRELPEARRKAQGKLLYNICKKYNIKIPTELELVIFGGAMIADWAYMGAVVKQKQDEGGDTKNEKISIP